MTDILQSADPGFVILFVGMGVAIIFGAAMDWLDDRR